MPTLKRLAINHLRNIQSADIELSSKLNIFYGDNGSGKTSILESISLLGLGRSFRSHKTRSLVNHDKNELTVFADLNVDHSLLPIGIQKHRSGSNLIRVNGETVRSASILAKQLPLLIINAHSFQLIEGSPSQRRQFLDWMVFHVKPEFSSLWKALEKTLKQRNSLLRRDKISYSDVKIWDVEFIRLSTAIDRIREEVFKAFYEHFKQLKTDFSTDTLAVDMEYVRGWDQQQHFSDVLQEVFDRDHRDGYTHYGPQRADIKIKVQKKPASDVLSRGQEKTLICAMTVAQASFYKETMQKSCVFLIDDLMAELDQSNSVQLADWLSGLNGQIFVTGVSCEELSKAWNKEQDNVFLFHVKQGEIKREDKGISEAAV